MKQDSHSPNEVDQGKDAAVNEFHDSHRVGSLREHLVRETLSDLENQLTADHHLNPEPDDAVRPVNPPEPTDGK